MYELLGESGRLEMKKVLYFLVLFGAQVSCSGPSLFNNPMDFVGGHRGAAIETHCYKTGGLNKDGIAYKLCQEGFNTHYGK